MQRLVESLADTPHRYVVSKGPQHDAYELADNMAGEEFLPQVSLLPHVDLVITHGGNNTTTECAPLRQADGRAAPLLGPARQRPARRRDRASASGFPPTRSPTRTWPTAIDRLLGDRGLGRRLEPISRRLQANPGNDRAADLIERLAADGRAIAPGWAEPARNRPETGRKRRKRPETPETWRWAEFHGLCR